MNNAWTTVRNAVLTAVLSDDLRSFITMYYLPLLAWGVYGTFFAGPATYVQPVMGRIVYDVWVWLCMVATAVVMFGLRIEVNGDKRVGVILQGSGHACMFWVLLAYEMSAITASYWGQGTFSIFAIAPYVVGCFRLTVQSVIKALVGDS